MSDSDYVGSSVGPRFVTELSILKRYYTALRGHDWWLLRKPEFDIRVIESMPALTYAWHSNPGSMMKDV
jgi:hypothetical protein